MNLIEKLDQQNMKETLPQMNVGDTVRVHVKIKEGARAPAQLRRRCGEGLPGPFPQHRQCGDGPPR